MQNGIGYIQFFGSKTYSNPYNDRSFKGRFREIEEKKVVHKKKISMDSVCGPLKINSPKEIIDPMTIREMERWHPKVLDATISL